MVELGYNEVQTIQAGSSAILQNIVSCNRRPQRVLHTDMTSNIILRGIVNPGSCQDKVQYNVTFSGNIAVPEGGTAGEIQLALAVGGEVVPLSIGAATPTVANAYWHVSGGDVVNVPAGCCFTVTVQNASVSATPATTPAPAINVRNLDVKINRIA